MWDRLWVWEEYNKHFRNITMKIKSRIIPAKPRSKELLNRHRYGGSSFIGSGTGEGKGEVIPIPTYWELIEVDEEGNPLEEPYIITKYPAVSVINSSKQ